MQTKVTVEKAPKRAGATPLFRLSAAQKWWGVPPARHAGRVPFFPRLSRTKHFVMQFVVHPESKKRRKQYGTAESTIQKTKNNDSSGSSGGRSETETGELRRVHRRNSILRDER